MCALLVLWLLLVRIGHLERRYAEDLGFFSTFSCLLVRLGDLGELYGNLVLFCSLIWAPLKFLFPILVVISFW